MPVVGRCRSQQAAGLGSVFPSCELAETRQLPRGISGSASVTPGQVQVSSRSVGHRPSLLSVPPEREAGANIGEGEPGSGQHRAAPGFPRFLATRCFITGPLEACFTDTKVSYEHGLRERRVSYLNQQTDASFIS